MSLPRQLVCAMIILGLSSFAAAQTSSPATQVALPSVQIPKATLLPEIKASVNDPAWASAATFDLNRLADGSPANHPAPQPTHVQLLWSPDYLYVRFLCTDHDIYTPIAGRDAKLYMGDVVEVFLDPAGDGRQYMELQVNPNNDVMDQLFLATDPIESRPDGVLRESFVRTSMWEFLSWNFTGLRSAAAKTTLADGTPGWLVDIAIPASDVLKRTSLKAFKPMSLRGNFLRYDHIPMPNTPTGRDLQSLNWSPMLHGNPHRSPARYGTLILVDTAK